MHRRFIDPRWVQAGLALIAVAFVVGLWLAPNWIASDGLLVLLGLSIAGGIYTFLVSLRGASPPPSTSNSAASELTPAMAAQPLPAAHNDAGLGPAPSAGLHDARHYRDVLAQAEQLILQGGAETQAGLQLYDSEQHNIANGHSLAVTGAGHDKALAELVRDYPLAGANVLTLRLGARTWLAWLRAALDVARRSDDNGAEAIVLARVGSAYRHAGQLRRAILYYRLCLGLARGCGDRHGEATALANIGLALAEQGKARAAVACYEQHLKIAQEIGDRADEARISWNLGLAYVELGDPLRAVAAMQVCIDFERALGLPDLEPDGAILERLRQELQAGEASSAARTVTEKPE